MKALKEYSKEILIAEPNDLVKILVNMTSDYGDVCESQLPIEVARMDFWVKNKKLEDDKPVSDTMLKMMWIKDGKGELERRMEIYKKALEKMMSNVKAILRQKEVEARNIN